MKYFSALLFLILTCALSACSDDETSVALCECEPDEYCVDDTCYKTDASIAPAPDDI